MLVELILVLLALLLLAYKYCTSHYTYWKDRSVPYVEPRFPFGSEKDFILHNVSYGEHFQTYYNKFKNEKMIGGFMVYRPFLLICDPELMKHIFVKDFNHFVDRGLYDPELLTPVNRNLFFMEGESWRNMRSKLTPTFTSGKIKLMYHLMEVCADEFKKALRPVAEQNSNIDIKDFVGRFTTDVIASCAFGLETNSITTPDSEFRQNLKKVFQKPPLHMMIKHTFGYLMPRVYKFLRLSPNSNLSDDFFKKIVSDTVDYREKNHVVRSDFIDLLMKIKHNKSLSDDDKYDTENGTHTNDENSEVGITMDEMVAQATVFLIAGYETSSSTMAFCLYELSLNPDIQERLHKEIKDVLQKHSGKFSYQALQEMSYLDAVINETMRRYASLSVLFRQCTEDYKIPDSNIIVPKGMTIFIPVYAIHHDPEYYPDPYKFDPERFLNDTTKTKNNFTFLPFGEGPRMCIGNRFGLLQMKSCLSMMINSFQFSVTEATTIPVKVDKNVFVTVPETPIILKISNRICN